MGTLLFMAPEQAQGQLYGKKIDMWACGIIMYMMLTGEHPFVYSYDNEQTYTTRISSQDMKLEKPLEGMAQSLF